MMAYRMLSGVKMSSGESVTAEPVEAAFIDTPKPWTDARNALALPPVKVDFEKKVPGDDYQTFTNCLTDAFATAAATLSKRKAQWGAESSNLKEWVRGQDRVFENCSGGPAMPEELTSGDALLRADRRYQIAAARFYAGQYNDAASAFDAIAKDGSSPWKDIAPYLAARAFVRQGTMEKNEAALREAAARLEAIAKDPARKPLQNAAKGMLDFVRAKLAPAERLRELEKQLMQPNLGPQLQRVLTDYTMIWDHSEGPPNVQDSDLANWIETFQSRGTAVEQWRTKKSTPWLIAALVSTDAKDPSAKELMAAARAVPATSPAWASATYWGIRLAILSGDVDGARQWADQALSVKPEPSVTNLLRSERLNLARDWTEFLRFAPRLWAATGGIDGDSAPDPEGLKKQPVAFDADATEPLNQRTPLTLWIDASKNDLLPKALQANIARAAWVRAVLMDDAPSARTLAGRVAQLMPELAGEMRGYLAVQDAAAARFYAVFLMLRAPGLDPIVRPGFGRMTPLMKSDPFRDNWWALEGSVQGDARDVEHEALADLYPKGSAGPPDFLSKDQTATAQREWQKMVEGGGNAVNFLAAETIGWTTAHPQDPRVPEALYLVVEATHYGPADGKKSREYSKQAFDILHRRYPASEWTKKTKYWF
jgi:tetratricopeptide (TPR) repeat protein